MEYYKPRVSIIVPVYNVEEYLTRCLDSLINQTLRDIEIICINDGSTDNSLEILMAYAKKDYRITVIDKANEGVSSARNCGLNAAAGEYIMFVDSDDWLEQKACELVYNKIQEDNSDILIFNLFYVIPDHNKISANFLLNIKNKEPFYFNQCSKDFFYILTSCGGKLYKKSFLKHDFNPKLSKGEDTVFFWQQCLYNPRISILNIPLYNYLQQQNSCMHNLSIIKNCELFKSIEFLLSQNNFKNASDYVKIHILDRFAQSILYEINVYNAKLPKNYYKKAIKFVKESEIYTNKNEYKLEFIPKLKKEIYKNKYSKIIRTYKKLFSVENEQPNHKVFTICGIKMKFQHYKGQQAKERKFIKKIKHNENKYYKNSYLLFDNLNGDIAECIDAYSLFRYMQSIGDKVYYVLLKNTELYKTLLKNNDLKGVIPIENPMTTHSGDFFEAIYNVLLHTKAIITSFGLFCSKYGQEFIKENPNWQYIFIQHGPSFLKESVMTNGYLVPEKFDKILISSEYEYKIFKKYGWPDEKFIKCGLPRWDLLNRKSVKENSILIMLTWRRTNSLEFNSSQYLKNLKNLLGNNNLQKYLNEKKCKLYFAPHHSLSGLCKVDINLNSDNIEIIDINNISEYIRKCSMLITDWSSVAFDFMFQNKPVIHYILDKDDPVLNKRDKEDIKHFDYKKYIIPNVFYDENLVVERIIHYLENNFTLEPEIKNKYEQFFYTKNNIRKQLVEKISKTGQNEKKESLGL